MMNREKEKIAKDKREFSAIDVDVLADSIQSSMSSNPSTLCSIYRVPDNFKKGYEKKYEPSAVSIGPYHCQKQNLKITEKNKLWYLSKFISRHTPPQTSLNEMVKAVKNLEEKARACYAEEIHLSSDDFVKMMVIDGCFILELFYRKSEDFLVEDLIYGAPWVIETVKQDLVLLENQLPFIILECLYQLNPHPLSLNFMVFCFFGMEYSKKSWDTVEGNSHLLDFLRNCMIPPRFNPTAYPASRINYDNFRCANVLQEIGVKFKLKPDALSFLDVTYEEGYLKLPYLPKGTMNSLFPNWIVLEQCHCHLKGYITSYILLLGQLLNSKDDVKFLRKTGIFEENENEDEKFATEVRMLCQRAKVIDFHYLFLCNRVIIHTQTLGSKLRTSWYIVRRAYFGDARSLNSFIVTFVGLYLTVIQTVYTIRSVDFPKV